MRLVSIDMLRPEMTLAFPVYYKNALVMKAGKNNIYRYIPNLTNMGIQYVYVEDTLSEGIEIPDAISASTRRKAKDILRDTMKECVDEPDYHFKRLVLFVDKLLDEMEENNDIQVSLSDVGTLDEHVYIHSINVCVYSLLIGRALGYDRKKMQELAIGTMLHDIGKTMIDPQILLKKGKLTQQEFIQMKKHTEIGYYIIRRCKYLPESAKSIALCHHERLDGSGYPKGIREPEIDEFNQITGIADVYDALTTNRCYKKKWSTHKAVEYLIEKSTSMFSAQLVQLFIQQIAIYPNGSLVLLSDGTVGIIKSQNYHVPLRPVVRIIKDAKGNDVAPYDVDMLKVLSVTIIKSELEIVTWEESDEVS